MKRTFPRLMALLLALSLTLSGCCLALPQLNDIKPFPTNQTISTDVPFSTEPVVDPTEPITDSTEPPQDEPEPVPFSEMEYTRPDPDAILAAQSTCSDLADSSQRDDLIAELENYVTLFSNFATNYNLANIHYSLDLTDSWWEEEYNYCSDNAVTLQSGHDALMRQLAASPHRELLEGDDYFGADFFDAYDGDSLWTEEFTALMEQEMQLQSDYYVISADSADYKDLANLLVEMVKLRKKIAAAAGYKDYPTFAYEFYYQRDYSPMEAAQYIDEIQQHLVPLYRQLTNDESLYYLLDESSEGETFEYVHALTDSTGGILKDCFDMMVAQELYHISYSENKLDSSFEIFLPDYMVPFVFVNPTGTTYDSLVFTHEFGHFCNDYASGSADVSIDVSEFFSQSLEYLSLDYVDSDLEKFQMYNSLCIYVEQAAYAQFELLLYTMPTENLDDRQLRALFQQVGEDFGFDSWNFDNRAFTMINHFYLAPQYVISYVVSNDAALQVYQMEQQDSGSGLNCYIDVLDNQEAQFLAFLQAANLQSPFTPGRIEDVYDTLSKALT